VLIPDRRSSLISECAAPVHTLRVPTSFHVDKPSTPRTGQSGAFRSSSLTPRQGAGSASLPGQRRPGLLVGAELSTSPTGAGVVVPRPRRRNPSQRRGLRRRGWRLLSRGGLNACPLSDTFSLIKSDRPAVEIEVLGRRPWSSRRDANDQTSLVGSHRRW
jgi:hypothetical protein